MMHVKVRESVTGPDYDYVGGRVYGMELKRARQFIRARLGEAVADSEGRAFPSENGETVTVLMGESYGGSDRSFAKGEVVTVSRTLAKKLLNARAAVRFEQGRAPVSRTK